MYVLCTLVVLTLHSLLKSYYKALESKSSPEAELEPRERPSGPGLKEGPPQDGLDGDVTCRKTVLNRLDLSNCGLESQLGRSGHLHNIRRKPLQVRRSKEGKLGGSIQNTRGVLNGIDQSVSNANGSMPRVAL
ncbi:hypothetical protein NHX12_006341 [Muraenolepis orangiensis]|uniref:Uncharacterized protein n=1 Tax=Muraenolepis orangiensis TaxID=630683 RepID=A0A9Q0ICR9_9TELE|nr:hypothetical protein NHX12_006341 [Muraenolepis orangiensis]